MKITIFEDQFTNNLRPFSHNHASFEVKTGLMSNLDRFIKAFNNHDLCFVVRSELEGIIKERFPSLNINPSIIPKGHCLNSRLVWKNEYNDLYLNKNNYIKYKSLLIFNNLCDLSIENFNKEILKNVNGKKDHPLKEINYLWDCIDSFEEMLTYDFNKNLISKSNNKYQSVFFINEKNVIIGKDASIRPGSVLDAEKGPIIIGDNVVIDIGSKIQGPVFIDDNSYISPGSKIRSNCMIGKNCKIGGEVTSSFFHGNSNKVHDGFIGHSYIGEWVNIGAGTNNSNLKNNYSSINFQFKNKSVNTNRLFLGSMIGDYTRIGISSMLNTGTYIGFGANIFGPGFMPKYNKSFSWGENDIVNLEKFLKTCSIMKDRRGQVLSEIEKTLIVKLYNKK